MSGSVLFREVVLGVGFLVKRCLYLEKSSSQQVVSPVYLQDLYSVHGYS